MGDKRQWLIDMREQRHLKQKEAAFCISISPSYLGKIENGLRRPTVEVAQLIASFYCFDWNRFFPPIND